MLVRCKARYECGVGGLVGWWAGGLVLVRTAGLLGCNRLFILTTPKVGSMCTRVNDGARKIKGKKRDSKRLGGNGVSIRFETVKFQCVVGGVCGLCVRPQSAVGPVASSISRALGSATHRRCPWSWARWGWARMCSLFFSRQNVLKPN